MGRKAGWLAAGAGILVLAALWAHQIQRAQAAARLVTRAERLLHAPFEDAPAFEDLRATEARSLAEEAEGLAASAETRRLVAEARAIQRLQAGDARAARRELTEWASAPEGSAPPLRLLRAAIELADDQLAAAEKLLEPLLAGGAGQPRALALASDVARRQGRADRALELAERGVAAYPSRAQYERRGLAHELAGDLIAARDDLERAAGLDPRPTAPLLHLGRVLRALNDMRGAVLAFQAAAQRNPQEAEAWLGSGVCRAELADRAGARADLERAEALAPTRAEPLIALADLDAAESDWPNSERRYRAATQLHPELALAWLKLGNGLMRAGKVREAIPAFRSAIERRPELAAAHNGLGAALHHEGDSRAAVAELELAARLDPHDPNPLLNLARVHRKSGDTQGAELALTRARDRAPGQVASADHATAGGAATHPP